jgi:A/G-specific adenine glycosylase
MIIKYLLFSGFEMSTKQVDSRNNIQGVSQEKIRKFQEKILAFYRHHKRNLHWRRTTDPYKILLSELMLQQTQVHRVVQYYGRWIRRWPTISALASVKRSEVLHAWMGLVYNPRAVRLHLAAQKIVSEFEGDVLKAMEQYKKIPGVGKYTSQAVLIFAANADVVTVDTNIRRIFISEFHLPARVSERQLWMLAERCLPKGRSREWHNALMDYGALVLTARQTGIKPKTRQSRFEGSDRQVRGKILRRLLRGAAASSELFMTLGVEQQRLERILQKMIDERLIIKMKSKYRLFE